MDKQELNDELSALLKDKTLFEEPRLNARKEALDSIAYLGQVLQRRGWMNEFDILFKQVLDLKDQLQAVDSNLFQRVRTDLLSGNYSRKSLRALLNQFTGYTPDQRGQPDYEYDSLDVFLERVIFPAQFPTESRERAHGMIRYEATPARVILELVDSLSFTPEDVVIDLGSGLGLVVILVNLLTGVPAVGIEYDPAYCTYSLTRARELNLTDVTFVNTDVRQADLNPGSIFYLFTPFFDEVFDAVIEKLRLLARKRIIYVCSYGSCTMELTKLPWLQIRDPAMEHDFKLAIFTSL